MSLQKLRVKTTGFFKVKKNLIILALLSVTLIFSAVFLISKMGVSNLSEKTLQIDLNYNIKNKKLTLNKLTVLNRKTISDERAALYSQYKLQVLDKNEKNIYERKINITEQIFYGIYIDSPKGTIKSLENLKTVIFIPYQKEAVKIIILKEKDAVLQINLPKLISYNLVESAAALAGNVSCGPITTVFINDNYKDMQKFRNDVSVLSNLYNSVPPFNVNPSIFDFKEIDTPQNFGCDRYGISFCVGNLTSSIKNAGLRSFSNAQKFIVLVDNPTAPKVDFGVAGITNGIGGDVAIFTNFVYPGPMGNKPFSAAVHEFEGHAVGYLWDRYVSTDPNYSPIRPGDQPSNCSLSRNGESFWTSAGSKGTFQGCANQNQYAPFSLTCQTMAPDLVSGGRNDSIMSAIGCAPNQFDSVEQAWIRNNILPQYKPCSGGPVTTLPPTPTPSPTPTPTPREITHTISGTAFIDSNNNKIKDNGEQNYSGLKIILSGAYQGSAVTDQLGGYKFTNLPVGWYTIQAYDQKVTFQTQNFFISQYLQPSMIINFPISLSSLATPTPTPLPTSTPTPTPIVLPTPSPTPIPTPTPASNSKKPQNLKARSYCDNHGPNTSAVSFMDFSWDPVPGSSLYILGYQKDTQFGPYYTTTNSLTAPFPAGTTGLITNYTYNQCKNSDQANSGYSCGFSPGQVTWKVAVVTDPTKTPPPDAYTQVTEAVNVVDCSSSPSPSPTPVINETTTYNCVFDPKCVTGLPGLQACSLICTPK